MKLIKNKLVRRQSQIFFFKFLRRETVQKKIFEMCTPDKKPGRNKKTPGFYKKLNSWGAFSFFVCAYGKTEKTFPKRKTFQSSLLSSLQPIFLKNHLIFDFCYFEVGVTSQHLYNLGI